MQTNVFIPSKLKEAREIRIVLRALQLEEFAS